MVFLPMAHAIAKRFLTFWFLLLEGPSFSSQNTCHDIHENLVDSSRKKLGLFFSNALALWPCFSRGILYTASEELFTCVSLLECKLFKDQDYRAAALGKASAQHVSLNVERRHH